MGLFDFLKKNTPAEAAPKPAAAPEQIKTPKAASRPASQPGEETTLTDEELQIWLSVLGAPAVPERGGPSSSFAAPRDEDDDAVDEDATAEQLLPLAEAGNAAAQYALAGVYDEGGDLEQAERWYRAAYAGGKRDAIFDLGIMYYCHDLEEADSSAERGKAAEAFQLALKDGDHAAAAYLGAYYSLDEAHPVDGIQPDKEKALSFLMLGAEHEEPLAAEKLAFFYKSAAIKLNGTEPSTTMTRALKRSCIGIKSRSNSVMMPVCATLPSFMRNAAGRRSRAEGIKKRSPVWRPIGIRKRLPADTPKIF